MATYIKSACISVYFYKLKEYGSGYFSFYGQMTRCEKNFSQFE